MKTIKRTIILSVAAMAIAFGGTASADSRMHQQQTAKIVAVSTQDMSQHAQHKPVVVKKVVKKYSSKSRYDRHYFQQHRVIYRVRPGDTLSKIAAKTGVSLHRLVKLNKLYGNKKNRLLVGQVLRLR